MRLHIGLAEDYRTAHEYTTHPDEITRILVNTITNTNSLSRVATYGYESWTLRKNEETRLDAFEMKGLRKILQVSWTAKKTNKWVLNKAGVKKERNVRHHQGC